MPEKITDIITYVVSLSLAAAVMAFAAYKVVALNRMDNPPANLGLNFPTASRKVITDADPLTTQSLGPVSSRRAGDAAAGRLVTYELLTVVDGVAFVSVDTAERRMLVPVTVGSWLPGGLTVGSIQRSNGRWRLVAGNLTLDQAALPPQ